MAIYHCQMSVVARGSGRSAVAAAAYRAGGRLENCRDGQVHDYTHRTGIGHAEIVLPTGSDAAWAKARPALWNAVEAAEKRVDARVAREFVVALPHELPAEERLLLTRAFAQALADRTGAAVDFAIHEPHPQGDVRNHHAHLLITTRRVTADGLGAKTVLELANKQLVPRGLPTTQAQLVAIRRTWEALANAHLARAGLDLRIDHRSHAERGLEIAPTRHVGVAATSVWRRGGQVERRRLDPEAAARNAAVITERPDAVLGLITDERSVFDRRDVARALHRALEADAPDFQSAFQAAFATVMNSKALVELQPDRTNPETGAVTPARYTTRAMLALESGMAEAAARLQGTHRHGVDPGRIERAIAAQDAAIRASTGEASAGLSPEQRAAIGHVTGPERIAAVVGFAGAGKSLMLAAARTAWEAEGYRVHGAALSGKAAEGLEASSGIAARTLASWALDWRNGRGLLGAGDVLVIDEAGMVGSRQLAGFVDEAERRGAKLVLVGDHEQLQAIGAGAPFRAIAERIGHAELADIRRQRTDWQRAAAVAFATHRTGEGLAAYHAHGAIAFAADGEAARGAVVRDYLADHAARPGGSRVVLAHRRIDVRALNDGIRAALQARGALPQGEAAGERAFPTDEGERRFAPGDRIVFLENDRGLGVKNGMLGTVEAVAEGRLAVCLDGESERRVSVSTDAYGALDHGYATTVHKSQGATVDQAFVLASATLDRHLTYVAMTRHRDGVRLYVDRTEFTGERAGKRVSTAAAYDGLAARLSRSGAKETVLDYAPAFAARRGIAERLGIRGGIALAPERAVAEPVRETSAAAEPSRRKRFDGLGLSRGEGPVPAPPERRVLAAHHPEAPHRRAFAGLKLRAAPAPKPPPAAESPAPVPDCLAERIRALSGLEGALERYAQAYGAVERQAEAGLPWLAGQRAALEVAERGLDAVQAGTRATLQAALRHDPGLRQALLAPSGPGRLSELVAGLGCERERQARAELAAQAERREQARRLERRRERAPDLDLDLGL